MDLIYTNTDREDVGVLLDYEFDLAFGTDENNFELGINTNQHCCQAGCLLYIEGTEYGGIIDSMKIATKDDKLTYSGRTWHGILATKVIEPDAGEAYLTVSGEANEVIGTLLDRIGLSDLFTASTDVSGLTISNYKMNRYVDAYTGIIKMLDKVSGKLQFKFTGGMVVVSAIPIVDYSTDEQFDNDQTEMNIEKAYNSVNHLLCLGSGELTERQVVHLYVDAEGNIGTTQTFTGLDEVSAVYDYANAESLDDLIQGGIDYLKELSTTDSVSMDFNAESTVYDVGDIVGAKEIITGIAVKEKITKKIVTINKGQINITYKVGE